MQNSTQPSKHRSNAEWEELFGEHEARGETQREFCDKRGISRSGFGSALRRRRNKRAAKFIEISPQAPAPVATTSSKQTGWSSEITFPNGTTIRIQG